MRTCGIRTSLLRTGCARVQYQGWAEVDPTGRVKRLSSSRSGGDALPTRPDPSPNFRVKAWLKWLTLAKPKTFCHASPWRRADGTAARTGCLRRSMPGNLKHFPSFWVKVLLDAGETGGLGPVGRGPAGLRPDLSGSGERPGGGAGAAGSGRHGPFVRASGADSDGRQGGGTGWGTGVRRATRWTVDRWIRGR